MNREFASESGSRVKLGQVAEFNLGAMHVSPARRQVQVKGDIRTLEPRVMQVLVALAEARPNVVPRDELVDACWGGVAVGDDAINRCIVSLRRLARGFDPHPFAIETVPRVGYSLKELGVSDLPAETQRRSSSSRRHRAWQVAAIPIFFATAAAGLLMWKPWSSNVLSVAVAPATSNPVSQNLARDLTTKLGMVASVTGGDARLLDDVGRGRADLTFRVDSSGEKRPLAASLVLLNDRGEILWSNDFTQPEGGASDLEQQLAFSAGKVLECTLETRGAGVAQLDRQTVKIYLNGCASYADMNEGSLEPLENSFKLVAAKAPMFKPVWARLIMIIADEPGALNEGRPALEEAVRGATKADPDMPEILLARAALARPSAVAQRMNYIVTAYRKAPGNVNVLVAASRYLTRVGLVTWAVDTARRAVKLDPLSPATRETLIGGLGTAGRVREANQELNQADLLWPGALSLRNARYLLNLRFGDPKEAIRFRESGGWIPSGAPYQVTFLAARANPTPENVDRAVREARAYYEREPQSIFNYAQVLGEFGRSDELFPILLNWNHPDDNDFILDVIFRPALHNFRRDPRFMRVAQHLGLLEYWQKSGYWPDLCMEPDLPYNCKAEAAKLTAR